MYLLLITPLASLTVNFLKSQNNKPWKGICSVLGVYQKLMGGFIGGVLTYILTFFIRYIFPFLI